VTAPSTGTEMVPLDSLTTYPGNARRGDLDAIRDSLRRNGQYRPLIVQYRTGHVLAGNNTLAAMQQEGWVEAEVKWLDVDDAAARRIVIADNRTSDLGTYDDRALVTLLRELGEDLEGTGYDLDDYDDLLASLEEADADFPPDEPLGLAAHVGAPGSSYGEGGSADGTNVRQTPSYAEYQAGYASRATRFLALIFPLAQYAWVVESMAKLSADLGVESNSALLLTLVSDRTGEEPPAPDATISEEAVAAAEAVAEKAAEEPHEQS